MIGLLPTKFYFPPVPSGFVPRPQLMERLEGVLTHRLTLVSAPAGAGKTTLVSAWVSSARQKGLAFGWLSLDTADNDPARFLEYLGACLEEGGTVIDLAALPPGELEKHQLEHALGEYIRGLLELQRDVVLILEDYHLIRNQQVHTALQYFLDHAPAHLHLILLTRSDPPIELARLRVAGQLLEVRMEQLRFSITEAAEFLERAIGMRLAADDVATLNSRAEGWVAGLQMAAISMRGRPDASDFVAAFAGSHRYVFDYLIEQVLNRQTSDIQDFLLRTSILERLTAPLCDAVAGTDEGAHRMLDAIERANLFLVPLDDEHGWYRYHHLFSDLLKLVLDQAYPVLSGELHHRACHWYAAQGMLPEALHHGLAASDMELVANIVSENVLALVEHAEIGPTLAKIDAIPAEKRASLPWLEVTYAWGLAYTGQNQRAAPVLAQAEEHIQELPAEKRGKILGHIAAVQAYIAWTNGEHPMAVTLAERADGLLPEDEIAVRALNLTSLGNSLAQIDDGLLRSGEVLEKAFKLAKQVGQSHVAMSVVSGLSYTYSLMGNFQRAQVVCEEALNIAAEYQRRTLHTLTASAAVYAILGRVLLETGEFEKALEVGYKGKALSEVWGQVDTIMICFQYLAKTLGTVNQTQAAREILGDARRIAQKASPWHLENVDWADLEVYLDSDPQDPLEIQREVTQKELGGFKLPEPMVVRVLIKEGRLAEAQAILNSTQSRMGDLPTYDTVRFLILQALVSFQIKDHAAALKWLKRALDMTEPDNRVASFVREGAIMERLLRLAQARSIHPAFVSRLLTACESRGSYKPQLTQAVETLIEPLSDRELEVLKHLNSYLSTPEIAELLVVSANTVRTHIKNIYGKLGVHGRSGAVKRAAELGLLA